MNTLTEHAPVLELKNNREYVFLLEHIEPAMTFEQLDRVVTKHNDGMHYMEISKEEKRNPIEIVVALLHQATSTTLSNRGTVKLERPIAFIKSENS